MAQADNILQSFGTLVEGDEFNTGSIWTTLKGVESDSGGKKTFWTTKNNFLTLHSRSSTHTHPIRTLTSSLLALDPGYNNNLKTFKGMISISRNFTLSTISPHNLTLSPYYSPSGKTFCWPRVRQPSRVTIFSLSTVHFMTDLLTTVANKLRHSHFGLVRRGLRFGRHFLCHIY